MTGPAPSHTSSRLRRNIEQFLRFGIVGASGVVVNQIALSLAALIIGVHEKRVFLDLPATEFNVRWYHVYATIAFFVANLWNFQINRSWTFRSGRHARWWSEYAPFLLVGLASLALNLVVLTLLMHPHSPVELSPRIFDNSTWYRKQLNWANLIAVVVVTPFSFVVNKLWTFRAVRHGRVVE